MRVIFFWECSKYYVDLRNAQKFCFWDKCIWFGCVKLSLRRRDYLSSAVNLLAKSVKVFRVIKRDSFFPTQLLSTWSVNMVKVLSLWLKQCFGQFTTLPVKCPLKPWQWSMNMVKGLSLRLNQCFVPLTILPIEGSSEARRFRHLSNHAFQSP